MLAQKLYDFQIYWPE